MEHALAQRSLEGRKINMSACLKHRQEKDQAEADQGVMHSHTNTHKKEQWGSDEVITTQPLLMRYQPWHAQRQNITNAIETLCH